MEANTQSKKNGEVKKQNKLSRRKIEMRIFTSPVMKASEVKTWCQLVRENKGKVLLFEMQLKSALKQLKKAI